MAGHNDDQPLRKKGLAADYYESFNVLDPKPMSDDEAPPYQRARNGSMSQARIAYEPQTPFYPPKSSSNLDVPGSRARPRSLPPPFEENNSRALSRDHRQERGYNRYGESDDSDDGRARTPVEKARRFVDNTFSDSTTGLGVGVLGALLGGLAAREVADSYASRQGRSGRGRHDDADQKRTQLISTVVGAAVGALGANAVEKSIEINRAKDAVKQERWEHKWRPEAGKGEVTERRQVIARPRSSRRSRGDRDYWNDRDIRQGVVEREVDPEARSWKNVEDWLLDDQRDQEPRRRDSDRQERSGGRRTPPPYRY
ncbi:hypothetical protein F5Y16DRAFT_329427 [Xylariaceae sp. FL0255]|nr:hypothetical protein F5Y16DRAFT_329427 [Xylariaceae sp. FL0255]